MAPRKKTEAEGTAPAPVTLTEDNIDDLDDAAFEAAKEAMDAEAAEEAGAAPEPSEAKEQEDKPEEKAEEASDEDGDDDSSKQDTVPHGRFHNERERRKAAEERAEAAQKRMDDFLQFMREQKGEKPKAEEAPQPEEWIDPRKDIFGAYEQLRRGYENLVGHTNQQQEMTAQERSMQAVLQEGDADIIAYINEAPEAQGAFETLRNARVAELNAMGVTDPVQQRQDLLNTQIQLTELAKQRGIRPAKLMHDLAIARGYRPAETPNPKPTASAEQPAPLDAIEAVKKLEDTKQRAQSLGGSGAPVEISELSSEDILNMSQADYNKLKDKLAKEGKDIMDIGFIS